MKKSRQFTIFGVIWGAGVGTGIAGLFWDVMIGKLSSSIILSNSFSKSDGVQTLQQANLFFLIVIIIILVTTVAGGVIGYYMGKKKDNFKYSPPRV